MRLSTPLLLVTAFCSYVLAKPNLELVAIPDEGEAPLTVQFLASIRSADDRDPHLYCLDADWDFDVVRFIERQDCPPFEDGETIQRSYSAVHTFERSGTYRVRLGLRQGEEVVLRDEVWVEVHEPTTSLAGSDGEPVRAEVSDLIFSPTRYNKKVVRAKGWLDRGRLRDRKTHSTVNVGLPDFAPAGATGDLRSLWGREVEVEGIFWDLNVVSAREDPRLLNYSGATGRYFIGILTIEPVGR